MPLPPEEALTFLVMAILQVEIAWIITQAGGPIIVWPTSQSSRAVLRPDRADNSARKRQSVLLPVSRAPSTRTRRTA